jgi:hypothetical protein
MVIKTQERTKLNPHTKVQLSKAQKIMLNKKSDTTSRISAILDRKPITEFGLGN